MSYIGNQPFNTAFLIDTFSGNSVTTSFNLSVAPATANSILVTIGGILQDTSAYGVNGKILSFSGVPPTGTNNISVRYLGLPASNITTPAYRTVTDLTATAGQTTFSTAGYTPGFIDVYRNGVKLAGSDFTATNGAQVVLASPANVGDTIQTVSFYVSSVVNAIPGISGSIGSTYLDVAAKSGVGAMQLPTGSTADRPSTPTIGYTRYNTSINVVEAWHPSGWVALSNVFQAVGGVETTISSGGITYKVHTFTSSANFTVQSGTATVEYLIVAGGAGGGSRHSGGGGAGGMRTGTVQVSPQTYTISVGGGGSAVSGGARGGAGGDSSALGITSTGGGGGGGYSDGGATVNGGSGGSGGGGASAVGLTGGTGTGGNGTAGQGNRGGDGVHGGDWAGGGGGGAGAAGSNAPSASQGGAGGAGLSSTLQTGSAQFYAGGGGGGGGGNVDLQGGAGGVGGGGRGTGAYASSGINAVAGTVNTGGGGGGARDSQSSGAGGSGIIIIRYQV